MAPSPVSRSAVSSATAAAFAALVAGGLVLALGSGCRVGRGGHTRAEGYTRSRTLWRAAAEPLRLDKVAVVPLVAQDREPIVKIDTRTDWPVWVRDAVVRHLAAARVAVTASSAANVADRVVVEVAEKNLFDATGATETELAGRDLAAAKVFDVWRRKTMELPPERWDEKYGEFATRFATSPFAEVARRRAAVLATPIAVVENGILRAEAAAAGATHVAIPARLTWVTDPYVHAGVKHRTLDATLEILVWSAATSHVVWRGHGVFKTTPRFDEPEVGKYLEGSVDGAAKNVVAELLSPSK